MKIFVALLLALPLLSNAQTDTLPVNKETGKYEFSEVVNVDTATADKLYSNAKLFVAYAFKSGKDVTQLNDDLSKTVIGKGATKVFIKFAIGPPVPTYVRFTMTIQSKDGRYRYLINDFLYYNTVDGTSTKELEDEKYWGKNKMSRRVWASVKNQIYTDISLLVIDLKKQMTASKDW
jgi:hypothetical protein